MLIQSQPTQSFAVSTVDSQGLGQYHPAGIGVGSGGGQQAAPSMVTLQQHPRDIVTYSSTGTLNGTILSIPKSWTSQETTEDMLVNVYRFVKSFVG